MTTAVSPFPSADVCIIGAGPAGLMAAETLAAAGLAVQLFERKPVPARKFLMAGRGGLNLTHSEPLEAFLARYGSGRGLIEQAIRDFTPEALRSWCAGLGEETFIGSSGRVFPKSFKASPLLRAWQARLAGMGVTFRFSHHWQGWSAQGDIIFDTPEGSQAYTAPAALLLALGGASWPRLGADGTWQPLLAARGVDIAPFRPANCGFQVAWSPYFIEKAAGQPLKPLALSFGGRRIEGEAMMTAQGIEGGGIYALSAALRDAIETDGHAILTLDLRPGLDLKTLAQKLGAPRSAKSLGTWLRSAGGLSPLAATLLREPAAQGDDLATLVPQALALRIKTLPLRLEAPFAIDRAISSAGGLRAAALDGYRLRAIPNVYAAGEMLDWEAPTGGYLLQASFATGVAAARQILSACGKNLAN
ncbi:MAG: TIGR03862 family flavoprotein [Alphaproteobacteria bacterium]|nr:TIGR03862 family flavoprotein [Alphaproteobacteria bacterium]